MQYRKFGNTGFEISALGFGAMRLPHKNVDGQNVIDEELSIAMMHRAFKAGVNYVDTAFMYCGNLSEVVVGKALKGWRDKVRLSTKLPTGRVKQRDDFRRVLDEQLTKLDTSHIDFYHFHGLDRDQLLKTVLPMKLDEEMSRAKSEGLIRHISFSFHDKPEAMRTIVDSGLFESVLCQYNLVDRTNEDAIAHAQSKGLGVVVMGPVGGGRLAAPMEDLHGRASGGTPRLAIRFVLSNPNVSCALSGMSTMEHVLENVSTASENSSLSDDELRRMDSAIESRKRLVSLYCTGCGYCMPCPHGVNIPVCFECMINHKVYGFTDYAMRRYRAIGDQWLKGKRADACVECGECEPKCPQKIPVRQKLKETAGELNHLL